MVPFRILSVALLAVFGCQSRQPPYGTVYMIAREVPLPPCVLGTPPASAATYTSSTPVSSSENRTRLVVRVERADSLPPKIVSPVVTVRQFDFQQRARFDSSGNWIAESLRAGPTELDVRAIGFNRLRDTIDVRDTYIDTVVVGLALTCR